MALARALMMAPKLLLCDEPTGNLDPDTGGQIMDLIFRASREEGAAALVVTHDPALTARAEHVLRLDRGVPMEWAAQPPLAEALDWAQSSGLTELVELDGERRLRLTLRGRLLSNELFERLV